MSIDFSCWQQPEEERKLTLDWLGRGLERDQNERKWRNKEGEISKLGIKTRSFFCTYRNDQLYMLRNFNFLILRKYTGKLARKKFSRSGEIYGKVGFFTSVGTTRGQGIIKVVVVVATFFWHSHFLEHFKSKWGLNAELLSLVMSVMYLNLSLLSVPEFVAYPLA